MIRLNIECETTDELYRMLSAILYGKNIERPEPDANAGMDMTPKPKPATKPKAAPKAEDAPTNGNGADPAADEAGLRKRATKFAAKNGPSALIQLQKEAGAPNGKISEIIGNDKRMGQLDKLLVEAQF